MTDLRITKLCADAMGISLTWSGQGNGLGGLAGWYQPLHDDAQAMALVKKFDLCVWRATWPDCSGQWYAEQRTREPYSVATSKDDLNRAICECVAKMMAAK